MIPIRDTTPSRSYPVVNMMIIGINVSIFLVQLAQGPGLDRFLYTYGLVPARYSQPQISFHFSLFEQIFALISFMFLHGGFWHLLGNMWSLFIFGDNVEDRLGPLRYLTFYMLCGLTSGLTHLVLNLHSNLPTIGASGAIAGVMGAYFVLYPRARILTLIPIFFIPYFLEIPAFFFLGLWFLIQFFNAAASSADMSGIAWWAHIGGFVFGILFLKLFMAFPAEPGRLQRMTERKGTSRLQVVRPVGPGSDPNLYAVISVSPHEATAGARKLVDIPWGFHSRMFHVDIPPGVRQGNVLRLKGMGRALPDGQRGDLLLKVMIAGADDQGNEGGN